MKHILKRIDALDRHLSDKIHRKRSSRSEDVIVAFFAQAFGSTFVSCQWQIQRPHSPPNQMPVTIIITSLLTRSFDMFSLLTLSSIATVLSTNLIKRLCGRPRPKIQPRAFDFRTKLTNHAWPSGDSAQAAVFSTAISLYLIAQGLPSELVIPAAIAVSLAAMYARVHFCCHWIGDTIGGALIGSFVTVQISSLLTPSDWLF